MAELGTGLSSAAAELTSKPINPIIEALINPFTSKTRLTADLVESMDKAAARAASATLNGWTPTN